MSVVSFIAVADVKLYNLVHRQSGCLTDVVQVNVAVDVKNADRAQSIGVARLNRAVNSSRRGDLAKPAGGVFSVVAFS